jgi:hypothetical protein
MNEGWVWLSQSGFEQRSIIKITNKINNKKLYCEYLEIDDNFKFEYNQPPRVSINDGEATLIINAWYRKKLGGIKTKEQHGLEITEANGLWGKLMTNIGHPQVVVRLATWLGIISVVLGILSFLLSID